MVIISKTAINKYTKQMPSAADSLLAWYKTVKASDWKNFADIKNTFNSVDSVGNDLFVFNIRGNRYRIIARIFFDIKTLFIKFIGTHHEYDKVNLGDL